MDCIFLWIGSVSRGHQQPLSLGSRAPGVRRTVLLIASADVGEDNDNDDDDHASVSSHDSMPSLVDDPCPTGQTMTPEALPSRSRLNLLNGALTAYLESSSASSSVTQPMDLVRSLLADWDVTSFDAFVLRARYGDERSANTAPTMVNVARLVAEVDEIYERGRQHVDANQLRDDLDDESRGSNSYASTSVPSTPRTLTSLCVSDLDGNNDSVIELSAESSD